MIRPKLITSEWVAAAPYHTLILEQTKYHRDAGPVVNLFTLSVVKKSFKDTDSVRLRSPVFSSSGPSRNTAYVVPDSSHSTTFLKCPDVYCE